MKPCVLLQKTISYPRPTDTTAVAELKVIENENIDDAIFVCRYIPASSVEEAHYEFYNVAYADQMRNIPREPITLNRVCFVRRSSVKHYLENSHRAQKWCDEVYKEVQRLLQSYKDNYPLGNCDQVALTADSIKTSPAKPIPEGSDSQGAAGTVYLAEEQPDGFISVPDGLLPIAIEHNSVLYKITVMERDVDNSAFKIDLEPIKVLADVSYSEDKINWKVWCAFSNSNNTDGGVGLTYMDDTGSSWVVREETEASNGDLRISDAYYPMGIEHDGAIYNVKEVRHDDTDNVFIVNTNDVRVLADYAGFKTYWRVWCMRKNKSACSLSADGDDDGSPGMIW